MGAPRRKSRLISRRRNDDEGEDDASLAAPDDSLSEPSIPSDVDDDADGEGSDSSEVDTPNHKQNGRLAEQKTNGVHNQSGPGDKPKSFAPKLADTEIMLNGLTIADGSGDQEDVEEIRFEDLSDKQHQQSNASVDVESAEASKLESVHEKRRREHEEYKRRRDADPAFVPNRGEFFMHDQRSAEGTQASNGYKPAMRGRGRGRATFGNHSEAIAQPQDALWTHDLHDTLAEEANTNSKPDPSNPNAQSELLMKPAVQPISNPPPNRTFSRTIQVGSIQLRVQLPGMKDAIVFSAVPARQHTRLPHHRPPLRRDKPVRISLPDLPVRYIFPAVDRSFIFIPRALRPNQQGFGRTRGRGSIGGPAGFRSGRSSIYGGSVYSPSVAMSRRSSFARERENMGSPAMSVMSRATGPVVRLPQGPTNAVPLQFGQQPPYKPGIAASVHPPIQSTAYSSVPMHQPRPQKAVAMANIDTTSVSYPPPAPQAQQPFAHQVPPQFEDTGRRQSHASQHGTPLSNIPERAIHAQPFQPYPGQPMPYAGMPPPPPPPPPPVQMGGQLPPQMIMGMQPSQGQMYYPQQPYTAGVYYYAQGPPAAAPMQQPIPGQQYQYMPSPPQAPQQQAGQEVSQQGTVAHESNGMVYYYDQSQLAAQQQPDVHYQQVGYSVDQGMNSGYMMGQVPQGAVYYQPQ